MASYIPEDQVAFAQLAVKQRLIAPEQVRAALELYRRYQTAGGELPSIARILVGKGWLARTGAELLLRHIIKGEPLTATAQRATQAVKPPALPQVPEAPEAPPAKPMAPSLHDDFDDLGLEPPGSNIDLPVQRSDGGGADHAEAASAAPSKAGSVTEIKGYKIMQMLGEGAMTIVYRAHQISMDRPVALKVLTADKAKDQRFVDEFFAEARKAGRLNHPNLIRVHEVSNNGDLPYYSMEFVDGRGVDELMDDCEGGRLDAKQAVNIFIQAANALEYGFRQNVIHREIRLNSIMVSEDGQAKLADLSLTKDEESRFLEGENAYYVAPEQVRGSGIDTRADIYCLGCCLFHCLTGEAPFGGGVPKQVLHRRLQIDPPDPRQINPDIPVSLANVVVKMMALDVKDRYQTPGEVAEALKKVAFSAPLSRKGMPAKKPMRPMMGAQKPSGNPKRPQSGGNPRDMRMRKKR